MMAGNGPSSSAEATSTPLPTLLASIQQRKRSRDRLHSIASFKTDGGASARARKQMELLGKYLRLIRRTVDHQQATHNSLTDRVGNLRQLIISEGLPDEDLEKRLSLKRRWTHQCSLRGLVWKILLGAYHVDAIFYMRLVEMGPSSRDAKIRDDTFRTFKTDEKFHRRVQEEMMTRILNAFVRLNFPDDELPASIDSKCKGTKGDDAPTTHSPPVNNGGRYVQGMNVLCGIFLYVMPEMDAFFTFNSLLTRHCPGYITPNLDGVHVGCDLVDRCLLLLDPELHDYLARKNVNAKVFAFPLLLSLFACCPPLDQALLIWDVLFASGVHLDVLMCVAQCLIMREALLRDPSPIMSLRPDKLPPLDAEMLVGAAFDLLPFIPEDLYMQIILHPFVVSRQQPKK